MELDQVNAILNFAAVIVFECLFTVAGILAFFAGEPLIAALLFVEASVIFAIYFIRKKLPNIIW